MDSREPQRLEDLLELLQDGHEDDFLQLDDLSLFTHAEVEGQTLLQCASTNNLPKAVKELLAEGAEMASTARYPSPLEIAARKGYYKVFEVFLEDPKIEIPDSIVRLLCVNEPVISEDVNHHKCLDLLLEKRPGVDVNMEIDSDKNTLLHYTALYRTPEKTLNLLRRGASMACPNKQGKLPVEYIDASTLETHLNECLEVNLGCDIDERDLAATFNYVTLTPPRAARRTDLGDAEKPLTGETQLTAEMIVVLCMIDMSELYQLLKHPVMMSFLYMKWHKIRLFSVINLVIFVIFSEAIIMTIFFDTKGLNILRIVLAVTMGLILLRGCAVIRRMGMRYFLWVGKWIPILTVFLGFAVIIMPCIKGTEKVVKHIQPFFILAVTFEIMRLIGQFPRLSTYAVMLHTVCYSFFKVLVWYIIFIVAFSLNFHLLHMFADDSNSNNETVKNEIPTYLTAFPMALFKTMVMLTGELDTDSMNFQSFPVTSHIIFLLFVFLVPIILLNLLTGLAVSDMQLIKSNAEAVGYAETVELIASVEYFLLSLPAYSFIVKFISGFFLLHQKVTIYPNQNAKVDINTSCVFSVNINLGQSIARSVKQLIRKQKEELLKKINEQDVLEKREQQQKCLEELKEKIDIILRRQ